MFNQVYFEISGKCNGLCHWCQTGRKNKNKEATGTFVDIKEFKLTLSHLLKNKAISESTIIALYNWGEPFLHPKIKEIINALNTLGLNWALSTNASRVVLFSGSNTFKNCKYIFYSMSGFSQVSYNKIHGFNFNSIIDNIVILTNNFRSCGLAAVPTIAFHIYQFNLGELGPAVQFAAKHKLAILPSYAFINDHERQIKFLSGKLDYKDLDRASRDLFLFYFEDMLKNRPPFTTCSQYSSLSIDSKCNIITCCGDSTVIGKAYELDVKEINTLRMKSEACALCIKAGAYYFAHNVPCPVTIINEAINPPPPQFLKQANRAFAFAPATQ